MRIVVFGATGGTGKQLVQEAIMAGNYVVIYARDPSKIDINSERLTVVKGELTDERSIEEVINGADAVFSLLGPRGSSSHRPLTTGMQNIVKVMKAKGVRRLVASSTLSVKDPEDKPNLMTSLLVGIVKTTMRAAYEDIIGIAETIRGSDLDWTIIRIALLNNNVKTGVVRVGYIGTGQVGLGVSRIDLANFMLEQVEDKKYLRKAPAISN
ncbi:MAG: SDR family oxidoreductase [Candidatus Bathyarchaeia archaeon]|jgi:putative NADH-flavin reductase